MKVQSDAEPPSSADSAGRLEALLTRRVELLTGVRDLTRRQLECLGPGEVDQLLRLLADKQRLVASLRENETELRPHSAVPAAERRWPDAESRRRCAELAAAADALRDEAVLLEQRSEAMLRRRRDAAGQEIRAGAAAAAAARAYSNSGG